MFQVLVEDVSTVQLTINNTRSLVLTLAVLHKDFLLFFHAVFKLGL